jgi:hypothetical protein
MTKFIRTIEGRLEAFNSQSELSEALRILLKFIDGRRDLPELRKALKPHICTQENIQALIDLGLVTHADAWIDDAVNNTKQGTKSYLPTEPATISPCITSSLQVASVNADSFANSSEVTLSKAKECMGDFVLRYTPESAFLILSEVESFKTLEQLEASLVAYEQLIKHAEHLAVRHMNALKQILAKNDLKLHT